MTDRTIVSPSRDYAAEAQQAAETHLAAVWEYFHAVEEALDTQALEALGDDPAIGAFDGCATCEIREALAVAVPILAEGIVAGDLDPKDMLSEDVYRRLVRSEGEGQ
jgi:hypothetical protein